MKGKNVFLLFFFVFFAIILNFYYFIIIKNNNINNKLIKNAKNINKTIDQVDISNNTIPHILFIYLICGKSNFKLPNLGYPTYELQCNKTNNLYECHETGPYLKFLIDNYNKPLADIYVFMHGHLKSWHYPDLLQNSLYSLITSNYINQEIYGGYECMWNNDFTMDIKNNITIDMYKYFFINTSISINIPNEWYYPCCGSFFIHEKYIHYRSIDDYKTLYNRIQLWSHKSINENTFAIVNPSIQCGRIFEGMWHLILSRQFKIKPPPWCNNIKKGKK